MLRIDSRKKILGVFSPRDAEPHLRNIAPPHALDGVSRRYTAIAVLYRTANKNKHEKLDIDTDLLTNGVFRRYTTPVVLYRTANKNKIENYMF